MKYAIKANDKYIVIDDCRSGPMAAPGYPMAVSKEHLISGRMIKLFDSVEHAKNTLNGIKTWNLYGVGDLSEAVIKIVSVEVVIFEVEEFQYN